MARVEIIEAARGRSSPSRGPARRELHRALDALLDRLPEQERQMDDLLFVLDTAGVELLGFARQARSLIELGRLARRAIP